MRWLILCLTLAPLPAVAACPDVTTPVVSLNFDSRYSADDPSRSDIDPEAEAEAKDALAPVDAFVTSLTQQTDAALAKGDREAAACLMEAVAAWAEADALSDLGSHTAELTIGSRLAAIALVAAQILPAGTDAQAASVRQWLTRRMDAQMTFWESAPNGSASGNLRAWAALAGAATALVTGDAVTRGWAAWSVSYVACTANPDGSLPQEMRRKKLALHYQVHAVGPLVATAALLERQGASVMNRCDRALDRIVAFTLRDLKAGGAESAARAGADQTLNKGIEGLQDFQLAWGEAWLSMRVDPDLQQIVQARRPLKFSKLGGDQTRIWARAN